MERPVNNKSCRHATFLMSKKEEGLLSLSENICLKFHQFICKWCRRFALQSSFISKSVQQRTADHNISFSDEQKQKLKALFNN